VFFDRNCYVPGKDGQRLSLKGSVIDRPSFEKLMDEYYTLRGWDVATGFQTVMKLRELGLDDIAEDLKRRGLAVG
jgi:aldehyde:ferredoxin oxidoreductase